MDDLRPVVGPAERVLGLFAGETGAGLGEIGGLQDHGLALRLESTTLRSMWRWTAGGTKRLVSPA